jgi:4-hydroxythreonine-4-phosphate dehydrogenase
VICLEDEHEELWPESSIPFEPRSQQKGRNMTMNQKPILGITMGDPASIGPEISVKALADPRVYDRCKPLIVGDASVMEQALEITGQAGKLKIHSVHSVEEALFEYGTIDVYDLGVVDIKKLERGKVSVMAGNAAFQYVKKVIELAMAGEVDATVTNALNKEAMNLAGHHYSGHTEIYADFTGTSKYTMMLAHENLRVVHVSTHVSLREACDRVKKDRVLEVIRIANDACRQLGIEQPKIGVAGLNPHSGENGMFGREEIEEITPAIQEAKAEGILADGPVPPDTVFSKARGGWYDIVVAMYHDQGHIPLKVVGFVYNQAEQKWDAVAGVNVTLGLPIIRASVDHGTAFDQAGTGLASELSLVNAMDYAIRMAASKE